MKSVIAIIIVGTALSADAYSYGPEIILCHTYVHIIIPGQVCEHPLIPTYTITYRDFQSAAYLNTLGTGISYMDMGDGSAAWCIWTREGTSCEEGTWGPYEKYEQRTIYNGQGARSCLTGT